MQQYHRFVPTNTEISLSDDAPGWNHVVESSSSSHTKIVKSEHEEEMDLPESDTVESGNEGTVVGPACWKCRGEGKITRRRRRLCKKKKENLRMVDPWKEDDNDGQHCTSTLPVVGKFNSNYLAGITNKITEATEFANSSEKQDEALSGGNRMKMKLSYPNNCSEGMETVSCVVCCGKGWTCPHKRKEMLGRKQLGVITRSRRQRFANGSRGRNFFGMLPHALKVLPISTGETMTTTQCRENNLIASKDQAVDDIHRSGNATDVRLPLNEEELRHRNAMIAIDMIYSAYEKNIDTAGIAIDPNSFVMPSPSSSTLPKFPLSTYIPSWVPRNGEQLCNLVGSWRILQRIGSHRWTTDDLVTAYVASKEIASSSLLLLEKDVRIDNVVDAMADDAVYAGGGVVQHQQQQEDGKEERDNEGKSTTPATLPEKELSYLDLGCGNGSVLLMTIWKMCHLLNVGRRGTGTISQRQQHVLDIEREDSSTVRRRYHNISLLESSEPSSNELWGKDSSCDEISITRHYSLKCVGIEARREAKNLACRSVEYNVGPLSSPPTPSGSTNVESYADVHIIHGDFRSLMQSSMSEHQVDSSNVNYEFTETNMTDNNGLHHNSEAHKHCGRYDLCTGTPPYFRVDFAISRRDSNTNVTEEILVQPESTNNNNNTSKTPRLTIDTRAVINQGGMPSCPQSAPARCEFRGGIEAYCEAASFALKRNGIFVVCENWLNDRRVKDGATQAGLVIVRCLPILGRLGKRCPLFAVYTMKKREYFLECGIEVPIMVEVCPAVAVRDENGKWTKEYVNILETMSIPSKDD